MQFVSTRSPDRPVALSDAILAGLAPDGGLFVPGRFPRFSPQDFDGLERLPDLGERLLAPFFAGETLESQLPEICAEALNFPVPLVTTADPSLRILELFHGPTAAFKDVGARFLAACLSRISALNASQGEAARPPTVMVATSGDTGSAVAAACAEQPELSVVILYPQGGVSQRQEHQLTCWGDNVLSLRVAGSFDDCQRMAKAAFMDPDLRARHPLTSANSISVARLMPQMIYYAGASLQHWRESGEKARFIVPTGNLGNALAGVWARKCGLPIEQFALATNANTVIPRYLTSGQWAPEETIATLASAMDVGDPSNMERLRHLHPRHEELSSRFYALSVDDAAIESAIVEAHQKLGLTLCPHTATAYVTWRRLREQNDGGDWIALATAHAAKFEGTVEPLIGATVEIPPALAALLQRPTHRVDIPPSDQALRDALDAWRS